jgi:beta-lactamase regulating signal transducer with metallopeptidase domain
MGELLTVGLMNAAAATLLALGVTVVGCVCRRPAVMHALWLLVLLKLVSPPLWSVPVSWPEAEPPLASKNLPLCMTPVQAGADAVVEGPGLAFALVTEQGQEPVDLDRASVHLPAEAWSWREAALAAWVLAAMAWWSLTLLRVAHFRRLLKQLPPAPAALQERCGRLAGRLGLRSTPLVFLVAAPISPMVWALAGRARLLVPAALWQRLSEEQRDLVLTHELAHIRRGDRWVRLLELVVLGVYWWYPVAWWASRRLRDAEEQCCDAWVIGTFPELAADYAVTILESAAFLSQARAVVPAGASAMGQVPLLRRRLTMILHGRTSRKLSWPGLVLLLSVAGLLLPLWPTWAEPQPSKQSPLTGQPDDNSLAKTPGTTLDPFVEGEKQRLPAKAELQAAQAEVEVCEARLQLTKVELQSAAVHLANSKGDATDQNRKALELDVEALKARYKLHQAQLSQARLKLEQAEQRVPAAKSMLGESSVAEGKFFDSTYWDLGDVVHGTKPTHTFKLKNTTKELLAIETIRTTAAALTATCSDMILKPNQTTDLIVNLDTARFQGNKTMKILVVFKSPAREVALHVTANSVPAKSSPLDEAQRLKELEHKVEMLLKDLDAVRKELKARQGQAPPAGRPGEVLATSQRSMSIPFHIDPAARGKIAVLYLVVSKDRGRTYEDAGKANADAGKFEYTAPGDGEYWFRVVTLNASGIEVPVGNDNTWPLKVLVDGSK